MWGKRHETTDLSSHLSQVGKTGKFKEIKSLHSGDQVGLRDPSFQTVFPCTKVSQPGLRDLIFFNFPFFSTCDQCDQAGLRDRSFQAAFPCSTKRPQKTSSMHTKTSMVPPDHFQNGLVRRDHFQAIFENIAQHASPFP